MSNVTPVAALREAIVEASAALYGFDDDSVSVGMVVVNGDLMLAVTTAGDTQACVPLGMNTATQALLDLAEEIANALETQANDNEEELREIFEKELDEIRDLARVDSDSDLTESVSVFYDIANAAQQAQKRLDHEMEHSTFANMREAEESLRDAIKELEDSLQPAVEPVEALVPNHNV